MSPVCAHVKYSFFEKFDANIIEKNLSWTTNILKGTLDVSIRYNCGSP